MDRAVTQLELASLRRRTSARFPNRLLVRYVPRALRRLGSYSDRTVALLTHCLFLSASLSIPNAPLHSEITIAAAPESRQQPRMKAASLPAPIPASDETPKVSGVISACVAAASQRFFAAARAAAADVRGGATMGSDAVAEEGGAYMDRPGAYQFPAAVPPTVGVPLIDEGSSRATKVSPVVPVVECSGALPARLSARLPGGSGDGIGGNKAARATVRVHRHCSGPNLDVLEHDWFRAHNNNCASSETSDDATRSSTIFESDTSDDEASGGALPRVVGPSGRHMYANWCATEYGDQSASRAVARAVAGGVAAGAEDQAAAAAAPDATPDAAAPRTGARVSSRMDNAHLLEDGEARAPEMDVAGS